MYNNNKLYGNIVKKIFKLLFTKSRIPTKSIPHVFQQPQKELFPNSVLDTTNIGTHNVFNPVKYPVLN